MPLSSSFSALPVVVCDTGTDTTRLGYAGNDAPTFALPTLCAWTEPLSFDTLRIGHAAQDRSMVHRRHLLDHGTVVDWNLYEEYWRHLFTRHLCVESSEVGLVLADAAGASPEQHETRAEILFESFGVAKLCVGSQALFALDSLCGGCDTGVVVMGGAGVTQVVPVVDGYAVSGAARRFSVSGRDVTQYVLDSLRAHGSGELEATSAWAVAERIKTRYGYVAENESAELATFDADLSAPTVCHREQHSRTGKLYEVAVGIERFLGPEAYFQPALLHASSSGTAVSSLSPSLAAVIDAAVWSCPIDCRRRLYANVVVCGGALRFPHFTTRLERELRDLLATRAAGFLSASQSSTRRPPAAAAYEVAVHNCTEDLLGVWKGGSVLGESARFAETATSRADYLERGRLRADRA